ncbi:MAG: FecR domain-containing protein [Sphingomonas bacterium]
MTDIDDAILDAAIAWHVRQAAMSPAEWVDFIAWLEADPAHARAYDMVSVADAERHAPAPAVLPVPANDDDLPRGRRWRGLAVAGGALAAALIGTVGLMELRQREGAPVEIAATDARSLALADGTRIAMAAGARMTIGGDQRSVAVENGRVTFHVAHDAARPFTVRAGDWEIRDVGTIFAVTRSAGGLDVGVTEGSVLFDPGGNRIALQAGEGLSVLPGQRIVRSRIDSDAARTLTFSGQPLRIAAETIGLVMGSDVRTDDSIAGLPFTGIVRLTGDAPRDMAHVAELTGMRVSHEGEGWIIAPQVGSSR